MYTAKEISACAHGLAVWMLGAWGMVDGWYACGAARVGMVSARHRARVLMMDRNFFFINPPLNGLLVHVEFCRCRGRRPRRSAFKFAKTIDGASRTPPLQLELCLTL